MNAGILEYPGDQAGVIVTGVVNGGGMESVDQAVMEIRALFAECGDLTNGGGVAA